jgi:prepilin-type processing-associated H-X9-DG protein
MTTQRNLTAPSQGSARAARFTLMELLVAAAVILVLAAMTFPVYTFLRQRANKQTALSTMKELGRGMRLYVDANSGNLPAEDAAGADTWKNVVKPEANDAWYNAIPRALGRKGVADFAPNPRAFYTKESMLFLPGARYPESDKKIREPLFAIAINTKLHRKDPKDTSGKKKSDVEKKSVKVADVVNPQRTVAFLEQGLPSEERTLEVQSKKDYDGSCKGSAKSFVGRYGGQGILLFIDGHAEPVDARDLLTETGAFPFPQSNVIWTSNPEDNPNKTGTGQNVTK